eukprot:6648442-Prorocentrum_lima.AAC.1
MTSSLVGSEMCIRDSARVAISRGTMLRAAGTWIGGSVVVLVSVTVIRVCLLYTSDAADDM